MTDEPNLDENQEVSWSAPVEIISPQDASAQLQKLVKVAILISVVSLLLAGYSLSKNVNNETLPVESTGESVAVDDIDLYYPPKDLPGLILKV